MMQRGCLASAAPTEKGRKWRTLLQRLAEDGSQERVLRLPPFRADPAASSTTHMHCT